MFCKRGDMSGGERIVVSRRSAGRCLLSINVILKLRGEGMNKDQTHSKGVSVEFACDIIVEVEYLLNATRKRWGRH